MKRALFLIVIAAVLSAAWLMAQGKPPEVSLGEGFRTVEVASVSDAMEQLYGQRGYMLGMTYTGQETKVPEDLAPVMAEFFAQVADMMRNRAE